MDTGRRRTADPPGTGRAGTVALFEAARDGDRRAFHDLVKQLSPLLWHVARTQGLDRDTCQDVVQTAWLLFMRDMQDIRSPVAVVGWLITTTKRECWRVRDKRRPELLVADGTDLDGADPGPGPEELAGLDDQKRRLWQAVNLLEERCRELLRVVAFVPRPDYGAVAELLGMKRGSVGPTRIRCLTKLRARLRGGGS